LSGVFSHYSEGSFPRADQLADWGICQIGGEVRLVACELVATSRRLELFRFHVDNLADPFGRDAKPFSNVCLRHPTGIQLTDKPVATVVRGIVFRLARGFEKASKHDGNSIADVSLIDSAYLGLKSLRVVLATCRIQASRVRLESSKYA
jgi:hypothetical protein